MNADTVLSKRITDLMVKQTNVRNELARLTALLDELVSLRKQIQAAEGPTQADVNAHSSAKSHILPNNSGVTIIPEEVDRGTMGATDAIKALLKANPNGLAGTQVVEALKDKIATSSGGVPKMLYSLLSSLVRRHVIRQEGNLYMHYQGIFEE